MAFAPRHTEATNALSVVAMGANDQPLACSPLKYMGPAAARGIFVKPIGRSMFPLRFSVVNSQSLDQNDAVLLSFVFVKCSTHVRLVVQFSLQQRWTESGTVRISYDRVFHTKYEYYLKLATGANICVTWWFNMLMCRRQKGPALDSNTFIRRVHIEVFSKILQWG